MTTKKKTSRRVPCARCGRAHIGRWGRGLESGRWVCETCYVILPFGPNNRVIDDMVAMSWEETLAMKKERNALPHGKRI